MRILIYGFGNLGKRHMQAALGLGALTEVTIHDGFIAKEKVEGEVVAFLKAVGTDERKGQVVVVDKDEIKELEKFNVVIDATLAHDRLSRLSTLLLSLRHQPDAVLVEKLVVSGLPSLPTFQLFNPHSRRNICSLSEVDMAGVLQSQQCFHAGFVGYSGRLSGHRTRFKPDSLCRAL